MLAAKQAQANSVCVLYCLDELDRLRVVLLCLGESANLAEAHDHVGPIKDRCWLQPCRKYSWAQSAGIAARLSARNSITCSYSAR